MIDDLRKQKWVLFGTGKLMPFYRSVLLAAGESVSGYADNDRRKWNTEIDGIQVVPPEKLAKGSCKSCNIVTACFAEQEIEKQLHSMGIAQEHIFNYAKLFRYYIKKIVSDDHCYGESSGAYEQFFEQNERHSILFDAYDGIGWGGMEMWSYRVAEGLQRKGHKVLVYGAEEQVRQPEWEPFICRFPYDHDRVDCWWAEVENLAENMEAHVPFTLINNWSAQVLGAALVVKRRHPDLVRIVTVVHNDADFLYRRVAEFADEMDVILCVSRHIKDKLRENYGLDGQKLCSHINFITPPENKSRGCNAGKSTKNKDYALHITGGNIRQEGEPLQIGWGGRLEVIQKRADLIPKLITRLDAEGIFYQMEITGNGDYSEKLGKWIEKNGKTDHVRILGYIRPEDMCGFWNRQHIYFNLSDYEGSSLAMLEAMACGAVPVVTEVSGVAEAVVNGANGIVVPPENIEGIVRGICLLEHNEDLRRRFSAECQRIVSENCRFEDYVDYIENLIFAGGCDG